LIYEFITPSDPITFVAENDAIAWMTAALLAEGKAGCTREDGKNLETMTVFIDENKRLDIYRKYLGTDDLDKFLTEHIEEIADAFLSFAYGDVNGRKLYETAIESITDPDKLEQFKRKYENDNRTSLNRWVTYAWTLGKAFKNKQL
jgi:hypothetical protein